MHLHKIFPKASFLRNMKYFTLIVFCFSLNFAIAQNTAGDAPIESELTFSDLESELTILGEKVVSGQKEEDRLKANREFSQLLESMLYEKEAFVYPFEKVKNLSKITAESGEFRIFSWLVPLKDGTFNYYGFALINSKKHGKDVVELSDKSGTLESPEYDWLKPEKWFGAIYYQTFEVKHKKKRYQIFLGYRPGNREVQEKLVEVMSLDGKKLTFGAKIFETPVISDYKYEQRPYRLRFRYSKKVVASIKYKPELKMIVMDHLSPPDASMQRDWKTYGPDFSYDGIYWENGKFYLKKQIEFNSGFKPPAPAEKPKQGLAPKKK